MAVTAKSIRRIVAGDDGNGKAVVLSDAASPDVHTDPARPGFYATRLWVTDSTPVKTKGMRETLDMPHTMEPPASGSVFRFFEYPPENSYIDKIDGDAVKAYFDSMGSPGASRYADDAPHPYLQKTETLDFTYVFEGDITLVLDTCEVNLKEGDTVIQRGTSHAWSNRTDKPCVLAVASHDGSYATAQPDQPKTEIPIVTDRVPFRRVVTGHDGDGKSCVLFDGPTPNCFQRAGGGPQFNDFWTIESSPAALAGNEDGGPADRHHGHSPPAVGAHFRIVQPPAPSSEAQAVDGPGPSHEELFAIANSNGLSELNMSGPGANFHRAPTVDYAINMGSDRVLVLDDSETVMRRGDVVVQLGTWHTWVNRTDEPGLMAFDMFSGEFSAP